jgi:hypothetical protein
MTMGATEKDSAAKAIAGTGPAASEQVARSGVAGGSVREGLRKQSDGDRLGRWGRGGTPPDPVSRRGLRPSYGARIFDRSLGRFVFTAPGVRSPDRVGQVVAGAFAALVGRDGFREDDLEVNSFVDDHGHVRPMDATEEATMNTAFRQFVADHCRAEGPHHGSPPIHRIS